MLKKKNNQFCTICNVEAGATYSSAVLPFLAFIFISSPIRTGPMHAISTGCLTLQHTSYAKAQNNGGAPFLKSNCVGNCRVIQFPFLRVCHTWGELLSCNGFPPKAHQCSVLFCPPLDNTEGPNLCRQSPTCEVQRSYLLPSPLKKYTRELRKTSRAERKAAWKAAETRKICKK